jgi:hypothetical protein
MKVLFISPSFEKQKAKSRIKCTTEKQSSEKTTLLVELLAFGKQK